MGTNEVKRDLSVKYVLNQGPCEDYWNLLVERFTVDGTIVVTEALCVEQSGDWDWDWAAFKLLSAAQRREYNALCAPALEEYDTAMRPMYRMYDDVAAEGQTIYDRVRAEAYAAGKTYSEAWELAKEAYTRHMAVVTAMQNVAYDVAGKTRNEAMARVFAQLFLKDEDVEETVPGPNGYFCEDED